MDRPRRLRAIGSLILAGGIAAAALFYWIESRSLVPDIDEAAAGYTRAQEHQIGLLMGPMGVTMSKWAGALSQPGSQAILIAGFAAFVAYMCFRHAKMAEQEEEDRKGGP